MADQEDGAFVGDQEALQQLEGLHVQVVGRLVQDQDVGRFGEELGEEEAVSFAAGQDGDGASGPFRGKQKILEVADDMRGLSAEDHLVVSLGHVLLNRPGFIQLVPHLVEIGCFEMRPVANRALLRGEVSQEDVEQGGFSAPLGPMIPSLSPRVTVRERSRMIGARPGRSRYPGLR